MIFYCEELDELIFLMSFGHNGEHIVAQFTIGEESTISIETYQLRDWVFVGWL